MKWLVTTVHIYSINHFAVNIFSPARLSSVFVWLLQLTHFRLERSSNVFFFGSHVNVYSQWLWVISYIEFNGITFNGLIWILDCQPQFMNSGWLVPCSNLGIFGKTSLEKLPAIDLNFEIIRKNSSSFIYTFIVL